MQENDATVEEILDGDEKLLGELEKMSNELEITAEDVLIAVVMEAARNPEAFRTSSLEKVLERYGCSEMMTDAQVYVKEEAKAEENGAEVVGDPAVAELLKEIDE